MRTVDMDLVGSDQWCAVIHEDGKPPTRLIQWDSCCEADLKLVTAEDIERFRGSGKIRRSVRGQAL